jgi:hypothetical protein
MSSYSMMHVIQGRVTKN